MNLLQKFRLNLLYRAQSMQLGGTIAALEHRLISYESRQYHRVLARGIEPKITSLGISTNVYYAQLAALMEYAERNFFYKNPHALTTSGMSAAFTKEKAAENSLIELVERDQVLCTVFYQKQLVELHYKPYGPKVRFFYMTQDLPIHVVMSEIELELGGRAYGFGASTDVHQAINKAFFESLAIYDSRNAPGSEVLNGNEWHISPFIWPKKYPLQLKLFSPDSFSIVSRSLTDLGTYDLADLHLALNSKNISIKQTFHQVRLLPFLNIEICRSTSADLQLLFFSDSKIELNANRAIKLGVSLSQANSILHPIG